MPPTLDKPQQKNLTEVVRRISYLRSANEPYLSERTKIRKIMNGGKGAVEVLLTGLENNENSLPAANHIKSGIERVSEMISPAPDLIVDPYGNSDKDKHARAAEKIERIVTSFDERADYEGQLEQASLWMVGYGFFSWKVCERKDRNGYRYPKAELRDPYTTWPSEWGVDQQPHDIAYQRYVDPYSLMTAYPHAKPAIETAMRRGQTGRLSGGAVDLSGFSPGRANTTPGWDGVTGGVEIIEYVDRWGTYVYSPIVSDQLLDKFEHPLDRAPIVVPRRTTFDNLQGQFTDVIGLASTMAKLTLLTQIVMEDAAFAPVVVNGRMDGPFRKGRDAVNFVEGGGAQYLQQNIPYQMFQEIDRIDRHLRTTTGYSEQADGQSPISFVTGEGLEELSSSMGRMTNRYLSRIGKGSEDKDAIQLEWDERAFGGQERFIEGTKRGEGFSEKYVPEKDIAGRWRTRRKYGIMAGLDEARRTVGMLQLLSAGVVDVGTVRENLSDIDNAPKVADRVLAKRVEDTLFEALMAMAQQGDPNAMGAIVRLKKDPSKMDDVLEEFFEPDEEDPQAAAAAVQQPASPQDEYSQILTRLTAGGAPQGGAQTMTNVGPGA